MLNLFLSPNGYFIKMISMCCEYMCYHQNTRPTEPVLCRLRILWSIQLALKWCDPHKVHILGSSKSSLNEQGICSSMGVLKKGDISVFLVESGVVCGCKTIHEYLSS